MDDHKDETPELETPAAKPGDFFTLAEIPLTLTYKFTNPETVILFPCKMALSDDDKEARQAFYAQSTKDQAAGQHKYYVELLGRILTGPPTIPGVKFDDPIGGGWRAQVRTFFNDRSPMKEKVLNDAIDLYNRIAFPAEFFR